LDRETNKALLVKHISDNAKEVSRFKEFTHVPPGLSEDQLKSLLKELKEEERVYCLGKTRAGVWHIRKI
jgi:ATP-dependent DNA helicase RecG